MLIKYGINYNLQMSYHQDRSFRPYRKYDYQYYNQGDSPQRYEESPSREYKRQRNPYYESNKKSSPSFQRSGDQYEEQQDKSKQPIWQQLYREGLQSKKLLGEKHEHSKNRIDIQCTFNPIIKPNKRYLASSNSTFLERVHIWQQHKIEKMIREKEDEVDKDLKECTFVPKINKNFRRTQQNTAFRQDKRLDKSQNQIKARNRNINPYYSPIKQTKNRNDLHIQIKTTTPKRTTAAVDLSDAKQMIRNELKRIAL